MNRLVLFPHMLGQTKYGVANTPHYIKQILNKNNIVYDVDCSGNLYENMTNLYNMNKAINGPRINIGGDHSMAIATVAHSLNTYPNLKLLWIDAHADMNTYEESISKNYHGMPLSFLTGLDNDYNFPYLKNKISFDNILYLGIRDIDLFEAETINKHNIKYITINDIRYNYNNSMDKIKRFINGNPLHISFDVDVMDPSVMYSTGTKVPDGLYTKESKIIMNTLQEENIVNIDITELNLHIGQPRQKILSILNIIEVFDRYLYIK